MNELIKFQLESLASQRESLFKDLYRLDTNSNGYYNQKMIYDEQINIIDTRVDSLLDRIKS